MKLWQTIWQRFLKALPKMFVDQSAILPAQPATQPAGPQTIWPSVECDWMIHGEGTGENEIRAAAIKEAAASGKAIRFKFRDTGTDLRIWTVHWESDKKPGYFGPNNVWSQQAYDAGIRKWVMETECPDALVIDTFKAYGGPDFQLQIIRASPGVIKGLGLDGQGIKTTPPRYR